MSEPNNQLTSELLERRRILILIAEAVEKLLRVRRILNRQRAYVEARGKKSEYAGVIDPLLSALDERSRLLARNGPRIAAFLSGKRLDRNESTALPAILQTVIDVALGLHEVRILLPREAVEPQVFHMLRGSFKNVWNDSSIVTTNALEAYEYRVEDVLANLRDIGQHGLSRWRDLLKGFTPAGSVLAQAFIDKDNPLAWPALAHEYGHAIDDEGKICRRILRGELNAEHFSPETRDIEVKWTSEIFADFVAARVLGPISQIPILLLEMSRPSLVGIRDEAPAHPPTTVRLALVREFLGDPSMTANKFEDIFEIYNFDYSQKFAKLGEKERSLRKEVEKMVDNLKAHIESVAEKVNSLEVSEFGPQQMGNASRLQVHLTMDLPLSSVRETTDVGILENLDTLSPEATRESVYSALSAFNEVPATSAEILTAGWLFKLSSFEERLRAVFPQSGSEIDLDAYDQYLLRTDELLLRSLDVSVVHSAMIGG